MIEPRIEHDEARRDEGRAAGKPRGGGPDVSATPANLGWDVGRALAPLGAKAVVHDDLDALVDADRRARRDAGDHVLVMSNGGFGGIHGKLLARLAATR